MKYRFGSISLKNLEGVHPVLVKLAYAGLDYFDLVVVDGVRTLAEQRRNVQKGVSKTMDSMHLVQEDGYSHALDLLPYPGFDWNAPRADNDLLLFGGFMLALAKFKVPELSEGGLLKIRYGGDWNGDWRNSDNGFQDLDHFELRTV